MAADASGSEPVATPEAAAGTLAVTEGVDEPAKPADEKPPQPAQEPAAEAAAEAAPPPAPLTYDDHPLVLPEGITFEPERIAALDAILGGHQMPAEARQQLADLHIAEMQRYGDHLRAEQYRVFGETRAAWKQEMMADPEFGGAAFETHRAAAIRMLEFFTPAAERKALNEALMATGFTDHPALFRLLNRVAKAFDEPAAAPAPQGPAPDIGRKPGTGRLRDFYNHPTSQQQQR